MSEQDKPLKGILAVLAAYLIWGFLPAYWKLLRTIPADRVLAHRIVWSFAFLLIVILWARKTALLKSIIRRKKVVAQLGLAALVVTANWLTYIYAVQSDQIIAGSLGYYISPLVSIALGAAFFRERFRPAQLLAIALATAGVLILTFYYGRLPWISLVLASTFAVYGLLKKKIRADAISGLIIETGLIFLPALAFLLFAPARGVIGSTPAASNFAVDSVFLMFLVPLAGVATAIPLLLFSYAARRMDLSLLGFFQYLAPTVMLMLGVFAYGEDFSYAHAICFGLIWLGLGIYTASIFKSAQKAAKIKSAG